jgi:hypothetical protein
MRDGGESSGGVNERRLLVRRGVKIAVKGRGGAAVACGSRGEAAAEAFVSRGGLAAACG